MEGRGRPWKAVEGRGRPVEGRGRFEERSRWYRGTHSASVAVHCRATARRCCSLGVEGAAPASSAAAASTYSRSRALAVGSSRSTRSPAPTCDGRPWKVSGRPDGRPWKGVEDGKVCWKGVEGQWKA